MSDFVEQEFGESFASPMDQDARIARCHRLAQSCRQLLGQLLRAGIGMLEPVSENGVQRPSSAIFHILQLCP